MTPIARAYEAGRAATPEQAQAASDAAHDGWRSGMDRWCRKCLEEFLARPDTYHRERLEKAVKAVQCSVEARRP